jgi:hypothetical protein
VSDRIARESDRRIWARQERLMRTLRIRIPEDLYVASKGRRTPEPKKAPAQRPKPEPTRAAKPSEPKVEAGAPARRRRFELPPVQHRTESSQSLIQPQHPPDLLPAKDLQLPEVFFWAPPMARRLPPKPFVQPGHVVPPAQPRVLDAPPGLELPTMNAVTSPQVAALMSHSQLAAPPAAQPLRTSYPDQPSLRTGQAADPLPGDPTNLLAITSKPLPLREFIAVPPGNQIGKTPDSGGKTGTLEGTGEGQGGSGGKSSGRGDASGSGSGEGESSPYAIARSAAVTATRIDHSASGVFDVVVQSSELEGYAESAGVLSGKPIYSVFLRVGAPKDWLLQYCIPYGETQTAEMNGPVVRLGKPSPLAAPFPKVTFRPFFHHRVGTHLMLHGFISAEGKFQELKLIGAGDPRSTAIAIAILDRWEFRPAAQDGRPLRVEILLAIPGE